MTKTEPKAAPHAINPHQVSITDPNNEKESEEKQEFLKLDSENTLKTCTASCVHCEVNGYCIICSSVENCENGHVCIPNPGQKVEGEIFSGNCRTNSDLDRGWSWVVMVACFGGQTICTGLLYSTGLLHIALLRKFCADEAQTTWASAIFISMTSFGGPLSSTIADRFGCRTAVVIAGLIFSTGFFISAFAPNIQTCIFSIGVLAGSGAGMAYTIIFTVNAYNFRKKLNLAQGVSVSGCGFGILVMPPIIQSALDTYGYSGLMIMLSGIVLQLVVFGTLLKPSELEIETIKRRKRDVSVKARKQRMRCETLLVFLKVLSKKATACLSVSMLLFCGGLYAATLQLPNYAQRNGFSPMESALSLSVIGFVSVISRLITGVLAHHPRVSEIVLYSGSIGVLSLITFVFPVMASAYAGHIVYSVFIGIFGGCCYVVINTINKLFVGVRYTTAACAVEFWFGGIGSLAVPTISGYIVSLSGEYSHVFYLGGACILLSAIIGGIPEFLSRPDFGDTVEIHVVEKEQLSKNGSVSRPLVPS